MPQSSSSSAGVPKLGTLGTARITPKALLTPARSTAAVRVVAIAARDADRAGRFALDHRIERVHADYSSLVEDPEIDAIYNPLPVSLHAPWSIAAIKAGKHVLCEKPFTLNAAEAGASQPSGRGSGRHCLRGVSHALPPGHAARSGDRELGNTRRDQVGRRLLQRADRKHATADPLSVRTRRRCHNGSGLLSTALAATPLGRGTSK